MQLAAIQTGIVYVMVVDEVMPCLMQSSFSFVLTSKILVFTSISCRAVILDSPIRESGNLCFTLSLFHSISVSLYLCFTLSGSSSMFLTHYRTVFVGRLFVPACIMMCDGVEPVGINLISDLIPSAFFPGKVRLRTCFLDIFFGLIFLIIESPIITIGESEVDVLGESEVDV